MMNHSISQLSILDVALSLVPVLLVFGVLQAWRLEVKGAAYAILRMVVQLALVGYVLKLVLTSDVPALVIAIYLAMVGLAAWISLRPVAVERRRLLARAFLALLLVTAPALALLLLGVIRPEPWYLPSYSIPVAGMIVANAMNTLSLAAERFRKEAGDGVALGDARRCALRAALIPQTNMLHAVGLVSLPGMMTGQILAGIDPLISARYQVMIMASIYGVGALSAALFLALDRDAPAAAAPATPAG